MKFIIFFILFLICSSSSFGQSVFNKTFESSLTQINNFGRINNAIQTSDSCFVLVGCSADIKKMSVIKLNRLGDTIWSYFEDFGINGGDNLLSIIETKDSNYLVGGCFGNAIAQLSPSILIKFNRLTGDTLWTKQYFEIPNHPQRCYSVKQLADNGFVFSGLRYNIDVNGTLTDNDVYLVKTDSMGTPEWNRTIGGANYDFANSIELTDDGGFMILGTTFSYGFGQYSMYCIKTDSLGNVLWEKTYGGSLQDNGASIVKLKDGNYAIAGSTFINSTVNAGMVLKIDPDGNIIWQKKYLGPIKIQEFTSVKQLPSGEIAVCGNMQGDISNNSGYGILKVLSEADGTTIWEKQYDYYQTDSTQHYFYGMDLSNDGGFVMAGMATNLKFGANPSNAFWVVKTDCMGNDSIWDNAACPIKTDTPNTVIPFNLYPNPSTGAVILDYFIPQNAQNQSVSFYDATGKLVQKVDFTGEGQIQLNIDCSGFANGVYKCVLVSDGEVLQQGRLVIIQ